MSRVPEFSDKEVLEWFLAKTDSDSDSEEDSQVCGKSAQETFREAVSSYSRRTRAAVSSGLMADEFVGRVAKGMPYIRWLFKKAAHDGNLPPAFSNAWFTQLGDAKKQQQQLSRGLEEHNVFILFHMARYDIGQSLGLFLVALMDRWVSIFMAARLPQGTPYTDSRARYGICFCLLQLFRHGTGCRIAKVLVPPFRLVQGTARRSRLCEQGRKGMGEQAPQDAHPRSW